MGNGVGLTPHPFIQRKDDLGTFSAVGSKVDLPSCLLKYNESSLNVFFLPFLFSHGLKWCFNNGGLFLRLFKKTGRVDTFLVIVLLFLIFWFEVFLAFSLRYFLYLSVICSLLAEGVRSVFSTITTATFVGRFCRVFSNSGRYSIQFDGEDIVISISIYVECYNFIQLNISIK